MNIWNSVLGMAEIRITCADMEAALEVFSKKGIVIFDLQEINELTFQLVIHREDYVKLLEICKKRGYKLELVRKRGLYWEAKQVLVRPVLVCGLTVLFLLIAFLPTKVFFVRVEGNHLVPSRKIIAAAEESGICFGASRRAVRSERVKNALLSAIPELQWVGVNTSGCTAVISVREKTEASQKQDEISGQVCSIVASQDGIIESCTVTRGSPACQVGQAVSKGQVLISGYTDCGICIQASRAEGEVFAATGRDLVVQTPAKYDYFLETERSLRRYSICIGKKRIKLWIGSGIWDTTCGRMYEEKVWTLPGGFSLPVAFAVDTFTFRNTVPAVQSRDEAASELRRFAEDYLQQKMIAGTIRQKDEIITLENDNYCLIGDYSCVEMISSIRWEQNGESHG